MGLKKWQTHELILCNLAYNPNGLAISKRRYTSTSEIVRWCVKFPGGVDSFVSGSISIQGQFA